MMSGRHTNALKFIKNCDADSLNRMIVEYMEMLTCGAANKCNCGTCSLAREIGSSKFFELLINERDRKQTEGIPF